MKFSKFDWFCLSKCNFNMVHLIDEVRRPQKLASETCLGQEHYTMISVMPLAYHSSCLPIIKRIRKLIYI